MSDDEVTEKVQDPQGKDCPAAKPLCFCGVRGCAQAATHARTMGGQSTRRRRWRR